MLSTITINSTDCIIFHKMPPSDFFTLTFLLVQSMLDWNKPLERGTQISDHIVELRDILHTVVDVANATNLIPANHFTSDDGRSLLCLLTNPLGIGSCGVIFPFHFQNVTTAKKSRRDYHSHEILNLLTIGTSCDYPVNPGAWRLWLDLEHSTVYNKTVHWNALMGSNRL